MERKELGEQKTGEAERRKGRMEKLLDIGCWRWARKIGNLDE